MRRRAHGPELERPVQRWVSKVRSERDAQTTERKRPTRSPEACVKARKRRTVTASGQGNHLRAEQYGEMASGGSWVVAPTQTSARAWPQR